MSTLKSPLNSAGIYFKNAKTRFSGCSYPKVLKMNPSFVTNVSPSEGTQFVGEAVPKHRVFSETED